jgi:NAD(P)-dependent dehydrogenase (short-subunit alcohol dehydrogenase family)
MSDLFSIEGKLALVTGGTSGIGLMIAHGLVTAGARVIVASRKAEACATTAQELSKLGDCTGIPANLGTEDGCRALADEIADREGALPILVNNAGANWAAPLAEYPDDGWDKVMNLNVKAVFHLTRLLVPQLEAASQPGDPARVINIGSIDGINPPILDTYAYAASKAGVHHLSRMLARKLAPAITVNAVAPGPFQSKMMAATIERMGDLMAQSCPMKRLGDPDDMAGVVIYLASRAGAYVTGAVIPVDGGISGTSS